MVLIELHLAPGVTTIHLSEEMIRETGARVMTLAESRAAGFEGVPPGPDGVEVRYIAVAPRDARWIMNALEAEPNVTSFRMTDAHE